MCIRSDKLRKGMSVSHSVRTWLAIEGLLVKVTIKTKYRVAGGVSCSFLHLNRRVLHGAEPLAGSNPLLECSYIYLHVYACVYFRHLPKYWNFPLGINKGCLVLSPYMLFPNTWPRYFLIWPAVVSSDGRWGPSQFGTHHQPDPLPEQTSSTPQSPTPPRGTRWAWHDSRPHRKPAEWAFIIFYSLVSLTPKWMCHSFCTSSSKVTQLTVKLPKNILPYCVSMTTPAPLCCPQGWGWRGAETQPSPPSWSCPYPSWRIDKHVLVCFDHRL